MQRRGFFMAAHSWRRKALAYNARDRDYFHIFSITSRLQENMSHIAAVVIAKNEARCIERCLKSVAPYVDKMVVLDTGSTDRTVEIARAAGAQVYTSDWRDDFSYARNRSLELADAAWNLVLDADEWMEAGGESLRDMAARGTAQLGVVTLHNAFALDGRTHYDQSQVTRFLPRGTRYTGRIHEQPSLDAPRVLMPVILGHDGYMPAQMKTKTSRNLDLLEMERKLKPQDGYIHYQIGKEKELARDFAAACDYYQQAFQYSPPQTGYTHALVVGWLYCLGKSGDYAQALERAGAWMESWQSSPDFFFVLGNVLLDKAVEDPEGNPLHWLEMAKSAWERCLEIGEQPQLANAVLGRGSYLAAFNLALAWEQLGDPVRAQQLRQAYPMP